MIRPGICSVTFRALDSAALVEVSAQAGLECIEWSGDAHVRPSDLDEAHSVRALTQRAGLDVASYGSYLRFDGTDEDGANAAVIETALAMGAPRVRVWAGSRDSADVDAEERALIVDRIRAFVDRAAATGLEVGLEFHGRTLTDEVSSTERLLTEVDREALRTYWQPHQGMEQAQAVLALRRVLPRVSTIHVFSWWPMAERLPLGERADLWREVFTMLAAEGTDRDALLEFVPGDDPRVLARETATLRELITAGARAARGGDPR
ncbi:sugar phosphate isomerase/epimerase [Brachybacterium sp. p3-SID957]|uniref:sugar phosphate isomerase/epimerase family protein n=1 Tax=Brachybacterium sp. p3-SID957 TaxID=2916049 RepID=UPI00223ACF29|nr:sugar phosphate isomerase/epimerase [Brachybacterium sp. p3-SID957]MCT1776468.1 sugar phosphate isomerase/epimerase [Brachybacterium sp. p3-SID957]